MSSFVFYINNQKDKLSESKKYQTNTLLKIIPLYWYTSDTSDTSDKSDLLKKLLKNVCISQQFIDANNHIPEFKGVQKNNTNGVTGVVDITIPTLKHVQKNIVETIEIFNTIQNFSYDLVKYLELKKTFSSNSRFGEISEISEIVNTGLLEYSVIKQFISCFNEEVFSKIIDPISAFRDYEFLDNYYGCNTYQKKVIRSLLANPYLHYRKVIRSSIALSQIKNYIQIENIFETLYPLPIGWTAPELLNVFGEDILFTHCHDHRFTLRDIFKSDNSNLWIFSIKFMNQLALNPNLDFNSIKKLKDRLNPEILFENQFEMHPVIFKKRNNAVKKIQNVWEKYWYHQPIIVDNQHYTNRHQYNIMKKMAQMFYSDD